MAPSLRSSTTKERKPKKPTKARRTKCSNIKKKKLLKPKTSVVTEDLPCNSSSTTSENLLKIGSNIDFENVDVSSSSGCSTPKAQRYRIPEITTCPPAPKKQRMVTNCSLKRRPIAFFAPPDIELFFFSAHRDISV